MQNNYMVILLFLTKILEQMKYLIIEKNLNKDKNNKRLIFFVTKMWRF